MRMIAAEGVPNVAFPERHRPSRFFRPAHGLS